MVTPKGQAYLSNATCLPPLDGPLRGNDILSTGIVENKALSELLMCLGIALFHGGQAR